MIADNIIHIEAQLAELASAPWEVASPDKLLGGLRHRVEFEVESSYRKQLLSHSYELLILELGMTGLAGKWSPCDRTSNVELRGKPWGLLEHAIH